MSRYLLPFLAAALCLGLAGCYSDQQKQLATCYANETTSGKGQPMKSILACMDKAGYRFVAWDTSEPLVACDMRAIIRGEPSDDGSDALCFEPRGWLALKIFHWEVPAKPADATTPS